MSKKGAAHQKKVDAAVRILATTTGVKVPQAMILAGFSKAEIAKESNRQMIRRRLQAKQMTRRRAPSDIEITTDGSNGSGVSPLTGDGDDEHTTTTTLTAPSSGPTHPKPKRKQIRATASAV
jgi:hypothetical protein